MIHPSDLTPWSFAFGVGIGTVAPRASDGHVYVKVGNQQGFSGPIPCIKLRGIDITDRVTRIATLSCMAMYNNRQFGLQAYLHTFEIANGWCDVSTDVMRDIIKMIPLIAKKPIDVPCRHVRRYPEGVKSVMDTTRIFGAPAPPMYPTPRIEGHTSCIGASVVGSLFSVILVTDDEKIVGIRFFE